MAKSKQKSQKAAKRHHAPALLAATGIGLLLAALSLYVLFIVSQHIQHTNGPFTKEPTWVQDFTSSDSTSVDPTIWYYSTDPKIPGYNNEKQAYTSRAQNVRIEPGTGLVIEARKSNYMYPNDPQKRTFAYTSGRIDTKQSFSFEYGKVEATIKLPAGKGVWPAFWLLSANEPNTANYSEADAAAAGERFYMKDGEIDIMEYYGDPGGKVEATVHTYANSHAHLTSVPDHADKYHTYAVELEPTKVTWAIDGKPYFSYDKTSDDINKWPFGRGNQFYIVLNLAMGGEGGGQIDDTNSPWRMEVKNVKFYDYIEKNTY